MGSGIVGRCMLDFFVPEYLGFADRADLQNMVFLVPVSTEGNGVGGMEAKGERGNEGFNT